MHACMHAYIHTYIHAHTHKHTYTFTHTYTYTYICMHVGRDLLTLFCYLCYLHVSNSVFIFAKHPCTLFFH